MGKRLRSGLLPQGLTIIYEDHDLLVVEKPPGLLTVGTERDKSRTAYFVLTDYVRKGCARSRNRVFIVHRLDRDTSGLLVFAKSEAVQSRLQHGWEATEKKYLAVVHGPCRASADTITSYLTESRAQRVYSTPDPTQGKLARTAYRVLKQARELALLEVDLLTGRKNQIRVHLADIGHPIVGDRKYGRADEPAVRLALHAHWLAFPHPSSGVRVTFSTPIPGYFQKLVGRVSRGEVV